VLFRSEGKGKELMYLVKSGIEIIELPAKGGAPGKTIIELVNECCHNDDDENREKLVESVFKELTAYQQGFLEGRHPFLEKFTTTSQAKS